GTWVETARLTRTRFSHTLTTLADGRVLAAGGVDLTPQGEPITLDSAAIYDPSRNAWRVAAAMPAVRRDHEAVLLADGRVLFVGGRAINQTLTPDGEIYDPATDRWTPTGPLAAPTDLALHTATPLADGRVLVAGGAGNPGFFAGAAIYDPRTNAWS